MNENELFDLFVSNHPASFHFYDRERFVRYAIEAYKNNHLLDEEKQKILREKGLSEEDLDDYISAFGWIQECCRVLLQQAH